MSRHRVAPGRHACSRSGAHDNARGRWRPPHPGLSRGRGRASPARGSSQAVTATAWPCESAARARSPFAVTSTAFPASTSSYDARWTASPPRRPSFLARSPARSARDASSSTGSTCSKRVRRRSSALVALPGLNRRSLVARASAAWTSGTRSLDDWIAVVDANRSRASSVPDSSTTSFTNEDASK
jgi:hypothetical protein